jgi:phenylacetyl-CoA:acceptor oxidoreductase
MRSTGAAGVSPLKGEDYDFSLDPKAGTHPEVIWDAVCRAATTSLSEGRETHDLAWFKEHGFYTVPMSRLEWYLTPTMEQQGLRYELPYQERLLRAGRELRSPPAREQDELVGRAAVRVCRAAGMA